jgi:hypothetical protein
MLGFRIRDEWISVAKGSVWQLILLLLSVAVVITTVVGITVGLIIVIIQSSNPVVYGMVAWGVAVFFAAMFLEANR